MPVEPAPSTQINRIDRIAIGLSGLCLVHCLATIVLVSLLASLGGLLLNPLIHEVGLAVAILLGSYAFLRGFRIHGRILPVVIGGMGLCAMGYALSFRHGMAGEVAFTIIGVILLAAGHELNRRAIAPACC